MGVFGRFSSPTSPDDHEARMKYWEKEIRFFGRLEIFWSVMIVILVASLILNILGIISVI